MFYTFASGYRYSDADWIGVWEIELTIFVCLKEYFLSWRDLAKSELREIFIPTIMEVNAVLGRQAISNELLNTYIDNELDSIYTFIQDNEEYEGIPLDVEKYMKYVSENTAFSKHISDSGNKANTYFDNK